MHVYLESEVSPLIFLELIQWSRTEDFLEDHVPFSDSRRRFASSLWSIMMIMSWTGVREFNRTCIYLSSSSSTYYRFIVINCCSIEFTAAIGNWKVSEIIFCWYCCCYCWCMICIRNFIILFIGIAVTLNPINRVRFTLTLFHHSSRVFNLSRDLLGKELISRSVFNSGDDPWRHRRIKFTKDSLQEEDSSFRI